jgi:hypothetical protein
MHLKLQDKVETLGLPDKWCVGTYIFPWGLKSVWKAQIHVPHKNKLMLKFCDSSCKCVKNISKCITKYKTGTHVCNTCKQNWHTHMHQHDDLADMGLKPIHYLFTLYIATFTPCLYFICLLSSEWQKLEVVNSSHSPQWHMLTSNAIIGHQWWWEVNWIEW